MSATSRHRLLVTPEQHAWITNAVNRKAATARSMEAELNKRLLKEVLDLEDKLASAPAAEGDLLVVPTTRNDLRILEKIAENERAALVDQIIPSYLERPEGAPYVAECSKRVSLLLSILTIVRKALSC